jgi:AraC family transcriptional regulator
MRFEPISVNQAPLRGMTDSEPKRNFDGTTVSAQARRIADCRPSLGSKIQQKEANMLMDRVLHRAQLHPSHRNAPDEIGRVVDRPPLLAPTVLRGDTRLTQRWVHGGIHDYQNGLSGHVVMTYYGAPQHMHLRAGSTRLASRTQPGSITLIPEGHDGHWDIAGPIEVSHVYLTDERLQSCADLIAGGKSVELIYRVGFEDSTAAGIQELLSREAALDDPASRLFLEQAIDLLCIQLIRGHSSIGALRTPTPRRGLAGWQVKRVTTYMRDNLDQELGLQELAALVNLSRFHFCTAFRMATGYTPHEWLTVQRIERAKAFLRDPELSITDIALTVGYQTSSAFAATFRKIAGVTPTEFRHSL